MAQRINITIPDELHQRMQPFKFNVSSVCQKAIESVVSLEEAKALAMSVREKAILRLKKEAQETKDEWFQEGKKDGLEAASGDGFSYEFFVKLEQLVVEPIFAEPIVNEFSELEWVKESADDGGCPKDLFDNYAHGVIEGLLDFWKDVKDEVLEETV